MNLNLMLFQTFLTFSSSAEHWKNVGKQAGYVTIGQIRRKQTLSFFKITYFMFHRRKSHRFERNDGDLGGACSQKKTCF